MLRQHFTKQCGMLRTEGAILLIIMDTKEHTMDGPLRKILEYEGVGLVEFSHKCWRSKLPNTHVNANSPIDIGYVQNS